jgi:hypothetical protein
MQLHIPLNRFIITFIIVMLVVGVCELMHGQNAGAAKPATSTQAKAEVKAKPQSQSEFTPSREQSLRLENAQLKAQLAQSQFNSKAQTLPEFAQFQRTLQELQKECVDVKAENKWPTGVECDIQSVPVRFCEGKLPCPVGK